MSWAIICIIAIFGMAGLNCQSGTSAASIHSVFVLVHKPHSEVFGDGEKCASFATEAVDAVQTATQLPLSELGGIALPCSDALVVNQSVSVARVDCAIARTCNALQALAGFRAWNAVKAIGIVAATRTIDVEDRSKEEGLAPYAVILAGCLVFVLSTAISTVCFRRSAARRARSVKFKDLVRFEIELAGDDEDSAAPNGSTPHGVPMPGTA